MRYWKSHPRLGKSVVALLVACAASGAGIAERERPAAAVGDPNATPDFNGDGIAELVVTAELEDVGTKQNAGAIWVMRANSTYGIGPASMWHQDSAGMPGIAGANDRFGTAWAAGDFDGDGFDDLAVGSRDNGQATNGGDVTVMYGSPSGLTTVDVQLFMQSQPGVPDDADNGDLFGASLAAGDFNGDSRDDLAIGSPREGFNAMSSIGAVFIVPGTPTGLSSSGIVMSTQGTNGIPGVSEAGDWFGYALTTGDFENDGYDDLAIGAPYEDTSAGIDTGAVTVVRGSALGLGGVGARVMWPGRTGGFSGSVSPGARFGHDLDVGEFSGNLRDDLVVCAPHQNVGAATRAGAVWVAPGSTSGITGAGSVRITENSPSEVPSRIKSNDEFCLWGMATGNLGTVGQDVLAVSIAQDVGSWQASGGLKVFRDNGPGILNGASTSYGEGEDFGISNYGEFDGAGFGANPQFVDLKGLAVDNLAFSVPRNAGRMLVMKRLHASSFDVLDDFVDWDQNDTGVPGEGEAGDAWGYLPVS